MDHQKAKKKQQLRRRRHVLLRIVVAQGGLRYGFGSTVTDGAPDARLGALPLAATELPTNKLATRKTTILTRPTSTPKSNASRSPSINKFNERAFSVSASAPA